MKKLAVFIALVGLLIVPAFAHPGGTDYKGGHTDHSTGEYHYHHGYSAHDHVDGVCPYDFDDKTGEDSGSWGGGVESVYNHDGLSSVYQTLQKGDRGNVVARDSQQSGLAERIHSILEILGISFVALITIGWAPLMLLWALFIELVDRIKNARSRKH